MRCRILDHGIIQEFDADPDLGQFGHVVQYYTSSEKDSVKS